MSELQIQYPDKQYKCLVIDPPWQYTLRVDDDTHRNRIPYKSMTVREIAALPISELLEDSAYVWLWITNSHISYLPLMVGSWGLRQLTLLTWIKTTNDGSTVRMGTGHYLRNSTEHCALLVKGSPKSFSSMGTLSNQNTAIFAPRQEHSRKPQAFFTLVDQLCAGMSKLEMFARESRVGYDSWGDQTEYFNS